MPRSAYGRTLDSDTEESAPEPPCASVDLPPTNVQPGRRCVETSGDLIDFAVELVRTECRALLAACSPDSMPSFSRGCNDPVQHVTRNQSSMVVGNRGFGGIGDSYSACLSGASRWIALGWPTQQRLKAERSRQAEQQQRPSRRCVGDRCRNNSDAYRAIQPRDQ